MKWAPPRPVATPDKLDHKRAEARAKWEAWRREEDMHARLELHRRLARGETAP